MGDLGAKYDDHLRLIGKCIVDFLLALIELFSLGVTAEAIQAVLFKIGDFATTGSVDPKFQVEGVAPSNHCFSQKTKLNDLSYGIKILTDFHCFVTIHAFDGQTDRQNSHCWTASAFHAPW